MSLQEQQVVGGKKKVVVSAVIVTKDYALEVQAFRTKLVGLIKSPKKWLKMCSKLDKDNDKMLSKREFHKIVKAVVKPVPSEDLFTAIWQSALRKGGNGGGGGVGLDFDTLSSWLFEAGSAAAAIAAKEAEKHNK